MQASAIVNTPSKNKWGRIWTHKHSGINRQIDYIWWRQAAWIWLKTRPCRLYWIWNPTAGQCKRIRKKKEADVSKNKLVWIPKDGYEYGRQLDTKLNDILVEERLYTLGKCIDNKFAIL